MSRFLILLSFLLALAAFAYVLADPTYGRVWPDYRQISEIAVWHGRDIGWQDVIDAMELRAGGEFRPRFLAYAIQSIDVKLRLLLYPYLLVPPTMAPLAWSLQIAGVAALYRLLLNLTRSHWSALAGVAVYASSIGFLSGFVMGLLQGKAVANASILISLWLASEADRRLKPGELLIAAPWPWLAALGLSLLTGLWIDEQPIFAFALIPLVFWRRFAVVTVTSPRRRMLDTAPRWRMVTMLRDLIGKAFFGKRSRRFGGRPVSERDTEPLRADLLPGHAPPIGVGALHAGRSSRVAVLHGCYQTTSESLLGVIVHLPSLLSRMLLNGALWTVPFLVFLILVVFVVPRLTEHYHGYTFDYLGNTFLIGPNTGGASSFLVGNYATLTPSVIADNATTLLGMSLAPHQTSPTIQSQFGAYPGSQINNAPKNVTLLLFFGAAVWLACCGPRTLRGTLWGALAALVVYWLFLSLLLIRHIPVATGYYYGASFACLFSLLCGLMVGSASRAPLHGDDVCSLRRETVRVGDVARRCGQDEILASRNLLGFRVACLQVLDRDPKNLLVWHLPSLLAGLCVLAIVLTQLDNFAHVHAGWQATHRDLARVYPWYRLEVPLDPDKPYEAAELRAIYAAWRDGGLEDYLATHTVSLEAAYLIFDLRLVDGARHPGRAAGM